MDSKLNFRKQEQDLALGRCNRTLEMLNHDFGQGWENDWELSQAYEEEGPDAAMSEKELSETYVVVDPEAEFCDLDEPQAVKCQVILREFVDAWLEARSDVAKWPLRDRFLMAVNRRDAYLVRRADGGARLYFSSPRVDPAESYAVYLFLRYITGDHSRSIGRCVRCRRYYLNTSRRRNRKYCSDRCNRYTSSPKYMREARRTVQDEKLKATRGAIQKFSSLPPHQQAKHSARWKEWVMKEVNRALSPASDRRITKNFITLAMNHDEINPPLGVARS